MNKDTYFFWGTLMGIIGNGIMRVIVGSESFLGIQSSTGKNVIAIIIYVLLYISIILILKSWDDKK